jgi:hypothetical protein
VTLFFVSFCDQFQELDETNVATMELTNDSEFHRAVLVSGAAIRMYAENSELLSKIITFDYSHTGDRVNVKDLITIRQSSTTDDSSASEDEEPAAKRSQRGRPARCTIQTGRFAVVTGRTYHESCIMLATAIVSSETMENTQWIIDQIRPHFPTLLEDEFYLVSDRSAMIRTPFQDSFPKCIIASCLQHLKVHGQSVVRLFHACVANVLDRESSHAA